ncbi:MAG: manganese efflux pump [Bacteroidaceae bacterium]|nr:manganese efflux pump [Bacteroidaceae bacterium]
MTALEIWLLGIALAMDCFSVSIASGAIVRRINWVNILTMAVFFGLFQALMPCIGWMLTSNFQAYIEAYDHWIAFFLLLFMGIKMIRESFMKEEEKTMNPAKLKVILALAIATSIDALAVGVSLSCTGYSRWAQLAYPVTVIGLTSFLFTLAGYLIGIFFGKKYKFKPDLLGGIVLICIGTKVLLSHLYDL